MMASIRYDDRDYFIEPHNGGLIVTEITEDGYGLWVDALTAAEIASLLGVTEGWWAICA